MDDLKIERFNAVISLTYNIMKNDMVLRKRKSCLANVVQINGVQGALTAAQMNRSIRFLPKY